MTYVLYPDAVAEQRHETAVPFGPPLVVEYLVDRVRRQETGVWVVRDDLVPGGTKARVVPVLFRPEVREYVYASPAEGYAQVALAVAAHEHGKQATIFVAARKVPHPNTVAALTWGAKVLTVKPGYLTVVQARAGAYCLETGAQLLPFGLDTPEVRGALAQVAKIGVPFYPEEVWCAAGSGLLTRSLQSAWQTANHHAVRVGAEPDAGFATVWPPPHGEPFGQPARCLPPFPSCVNYDAKVWAYVTTHRDARPLFWNVAA